MLALLLNFTGDEFVFVFLLCFVLVAIGAVVSVTSKYLRHKAKESAYKDPESRFLIWDERQLSLPASV